GCPTQGTRSTSLPSGRVRVLGAEGAGGATGGAAQPGTAAASTAANRKQPGRRRLKEGFWFMAPDWTKDRAQTPPLRGSRKERQPRLRRQGLKSPGYPL